MHAFIVGGSKGIGSAIADHLRTLEHRVVTGARTGADVSIDLCASPGAIETACREAMAALDGHLDWLVISAGRGAEYAPWEETAERAEALMAVNFHGRQQVFKALVKHLQRARGKVVFIGSDCVSNQKRYPGGALYKASHAAMQSFSEEKAKAYACVGVAINVVAPSWVSTDMTAGFKEERVQKILRRMPLGRFLWPEEVARVVVGVLEMPHVLTGATIPVTGGFS